MTALAQVGVYQTGTERGFISLFDASHQYFVAEATPLTPLTPSLSNDKCPVRLVHCGTAIPRSHGICEHAISSTLNSGWGRRHIGAVELPITITTELLSDPRFLSKAFCLPRSDTHQYQFYAAVPIRTRAGIDIGTYSVLSPSQPASWDENCAQRLRNVSGAIMEHLVAKRSTHAHRRNERVNRGLGSFIEGKATLSGWRAGSNTAAYTDNIKSDEGMLDTKQQLIERRAEAAMGNDFLVQTPPAVTPVMETTIPADTISHYFGSIPTASVQDKVGKTPQSRESGPLPTPPRLPAAANVAEAEAANTSEESVAQIFSRAANIIRESFEVEGCLFFDVTLGSYRAVSIEHAHSNGGGDHSDNSASPTTSSSEDHFFMSPVVESPDSASDVLAFSTSQASSLNMHDFSGPNEHMTKRLLAKLLRRYPNGMIFNYDASGELQSSDYSEEDGSTDSLPRDKPASSVVSQEATSDGTEGTTPRRTRTNHRFSRVIEAASIYKVFPAARSIVFVPIWDSKRDRWLAGNFIYTLTPTRLFSVEAELSILKAFGKIIAAEVHSLEAQQMDKAKSDTLGSISHELRSPLHGIMLSTELLNDTDMSVFQSNASHTIETCCRTLLDTIDHLLDYSKVNSFGSKHQRSSHSTSHRTQQMQAKAKKSPLGHRAMHTHTRLDSVLEEVTNSMFAGFHFQYSSIKQLSKGKSPWTDTAAHNRLDGAQALEQLGTGAIAGHGQGQATLKLFVRDVSVYVSIDPTFSWMFYSQIGAIRRIVMNLFGNALKYTNQGFIHVSLRQETATAGTGTMRHSKGQRIVTLVVQDTGQGMKEDFLTHKLFRPFTQEDELASGTGLGLSIVKSAVTQLSGRIQVQSKAGVGTVVTVRLPLLLSSEIHNPIGLPDDAAFEHSVQKLKGMRVRIISLGLEQEAGEMASRDIGLDVMQDICRRWLRLDLLGDERAQHVDPDFVLWLDRGVLQSTALSDEQIARYPNVIVCKDPFLAYDGYRTPKSAGEGVFEYITQP